MPGTAFRGKGEQGHPRTHSEEVARQLGGGNRYIRQLFHRRVRDNAAVRHEQHAILPQARVLQFHHQATGSGDGLRGDLDDLKQRPQHAASALVGAGYEAVRLVHRDHHRPKIVGLEQGLPRLEAFQAFYRRKISKRRAKFSNSSLSAGLIMRMPSKETFKAMAISLMRVRSPSRIGAHLKE